MMSKTQFFLNDLVKIENLMKKNWVLEVDLIIKSSSLLTIVHFCLNNFK